MYFKAVKTLLDKSIDRYATRKGIDVEDVHDEIAEYFAVMAKEHREDDPSIPYDNPLCRLAYLYKHVPANACLFERSLRSLDSAKEVVKSRKSSRLRICAVGGGPGSELLGLAKYFIKRAGAGAPSRLDFVLLDAVPEWSETWSMLAEEVEAQMAKAAEDEWTPPVVSPQFLPMNVVDKKSYSGMAWRFENIDLVVFNYLISENLSHLPKVEGMLRELASCSSDDAVFMFIDRREHTERINTWLKSNLASCDLELADGPELLGDSIDGDEQVSPHLGDYPDAFKQWPRLKFFNPGNRGATAFCMSARRKP